MSMPAAAADVTVGLVRGLLADQHPDLAGLPIESLAEGWDNTSFRIGSELIARLPLPSPAPARTGRAALGYPPPFSPTRRNDVAASPGAFLVAPHQPAPPDAPVNPMRGNFIC